MIIYIPLSHHNPKVWKWLVSIDHAYQWVNEDHIEISTEQIAIEFKEQFDL